MSSKFLFFTNFWKNFVYLLAKSVFVIGQFSPAFVTLFLRTCLCFLNNSHSHNKWFEVCGLIFNMHVDSSIILNLCKYDLSLPWPVTILDMFMQNCSLFDNLSCTLGKKVFVTAPWVVWAPSPCHFGSPPRFSSLDTSLFGYLW
jgi:hypothetical protein